MCETCGCSDGAKASLTDLQSGETVALSDTHEHGHSHSEPHHHHDHGHGPHDGHTHSHEHGHPHTHSHGTTVELEKAILAKNNQLAERNRGWFAGRNIL